MTSLIYIKFRKVLVMIPWFRNVIVIIIFQEFNSCKRKEKPSFLDYSERIVLLYFVCSLNGSDLCLTLKV